MYKILANTLFFGKTLVYVPQCHSTNRLAEELSQKAETPEGTIVITDNQMEGRGQRGNSWEAEPGKNLTFSLILRPGFLKAGEQFQINRVITLGLAEYVQQRIPAEVRIKWPNDILVGDLKVSGILIENHLSGNAIHHSVAGVGMNVNQDSFKYPSASSLKLITGMEYSLETELEILCGCIEGKYLELRSGRTGNLENNYLALLYRRNENRLFRTDRLEFEGTITGVDEVGRLKIKTGEGEKVFGVKEVEFL